MLEGAKKIGFEKVDCCDHSAYIKNVSTDEKVVESFESSHEENSLFEGFNENSESNKSLWPQNSFTS